MIKVLSGTLKRETTVNGQKITFLTKDIAEVDRFFSKSINKPVSVDFRCIKERRSLNANNYCWHLCDEIAKVIRSTKEEVYRKAIREVGIFHDGAFQVQDLPEIKRAWESNGVGWFCEDFDSKLSGCRRVRFYHGSSLYDTQEMSRLIDYIVEEAKALDIETMTPDEIEKMKQQWGTD